MNLAPFPWFGGKSRVASTVWRYFGDIQNYVEPFFGSGAVLLGRPRGAAGVETVNDIDGLVCNFWRAVTADPETVARAADWPVNENDLHARHVWLKGELPMLVPRLEGDPDYHDTKIAGWWVWGMAQWIGGGFCGASGGGPWQIQEDHDGRLELVHLGDAGQGVSRRLVHLGDAGRGVSRQLVHLGSAGQGVSQVSRGLREWFQALQQRLRRVRVCCGDWQRILSPAVTTTHGITGVFLDPPYGDAAGRDMNLYACDDGAVARAARDWAVEHGDDPLMRIMLCGYDGEHQMPARWTCVPWSAQGGYANQGTGAGRENRHRARLWCSPHCQEPLPLFAAGRADG